MRNAKGQFAKGYKNPKEMEIKRINSLKLAYVSGKRKPLLYWLGKKLSQEHRKKVSIGNIGKKRTKEQKIIIANRVKELWKNPEYRKMMIAKHIGHKQSFKTIEKRVAQFRKEKNWNWKGGITPLVRKIRGCWKMQQWKRDCRRLSKKCVLCKSDKNLLVDHIKTFSLIIRQNKINTYEKALECIELWEIKNGRVLCKSCHLKTDTYGNRNIQIQ